MVQLAGSICIATFGKPYKQFLQAASAVPSQIPYRPRSTVAVDQPEGHNLAADPLWDSAKPFSEIPGPKPLPIIGNVWRFLPKIGDFGKAGAVSVYTTLYKRYGSIVMFKGIPGRNELLFLYDADGIEKVLRNEGVWPVRIGLESLQAYRKLRSEKYEGAFGLGATNGKEWADFRSAVNQIMMKPKNVKMYVDPINDVTQEFIDRMRVIRDENNEMPDDYNKEVAKWGLESITLIALDTRLGCLANDLKEDSEPYRMIETVQTLFNCLYHLDVRPSLWKYISTPMWRRLVRTSDAFHAICMKYIGRAMKTLQDLPPEQMKERDLSVLEILLLQNDNPRIAGTMAIDMMTAGIDTTSNSSTTTIFYLATNPDKQEKLRQEIDRELPTKDTRITSQKLENMKYLRACIKEAMRMETIVSGITRVTPRDLVIMGYQIPKGTQVIAANSVAAHNEAYFPRPSEYIPERWLPDKEYDHLRARHPFAYLPFGFGPRMCVGRRFAELEMETLIAKIFRNFKVSWHYPEPKREMWLLKVMTSPLKFRMVDRED